MNDFINNKQKDLLITVDGVDGVGKSTFIIDLEREIEFVLAEHCLDTHCVSRISPFGDEPANTNRALNTQTNKRKALKKFIDKVGTKYSWGNEDADEELLANLFFLSNISVIKDIESCKCEAKKQVYLIDRSFISFQIYQEITVDDFVKNYHACILLVDNEKDIIKRLKRRARHDVFDSKYLTSTSLYQNKFLEYAEFHKTIKNNPPIFIYNLSDYTKKEDTGIECYTRIAKDFVTKFLK